MKQARALLIRACQVERKALLEKLEGGHRQWNELRDHLERYIDLLSAADLLGEHEDKGHFFLTEELAAQYSL